MTCKQEKEEQELSPFHDLSGFAPRLKKKTVPMLDLIYYYVIIPES